MKAVVALATILTVLTAVHAAPSEQVSLPECTDQQLLGFVPANDEVLAHRLFSLPSIHYEFGKAPDVDGRWGITVALRINQSGRPVCYSRKTSVGEFFSDNTERRIVIAGMGAWRYQPFLHKNIPVAAIVEERVDEQELPKMHLPLPKVRLQDVTIGLSRGGCNGLCPIYQLTIDGTGRVSYDGRMFVDVLGHHEYRVNPQIVAQLVERMKKEDIWSLRPVYRASMTDQSNYLLTIDLGNERHTLEDYVGRDAGMPSAVSDFEDEVDRAARAEMWIHLSGEAVQHLQAEHFDFRSPAAKALLEGSNANEETLDDSAILKLIQLGAPITDTALPRRGSSSRPRETVLETASRNNRAIVVDALVQRGALQTAGQPDQKKVDGAFRAAIEGGRLSMVEKIWNLYGGSLRPSLTFESEYEGVRKLAPVTLMLTHPYYEPRDWDGFAIAKWLASLGCDLKANDAQGTTLLHIATEAGDLSFVRYLLDTGFDPSAPGRFGLPALGSAHDEDIAMALLEAGTDLTRIRDDDNGAQFLRFATGNHWERVIAWMAVHGIS